MDIKTWADFAALPKEDLEALTPEEVETLKTSISDNESKIAEDYKKKDEELAKAKEIAENQRIRAEKAEQAGKEKPELSLKDYKALSDIHDDDVDELVSFSKFKNIPISEAKKSPIIQTYLRDREEERKSAIASQAQKNTTSKVSSDTLLEKASQGQLPENDIEKLVEAEMAAKHKK